MLHNNDHGFVGAIPLASALLVKSNAFCKSLQIYFTNLTYIFYKLLYVNCLNDKTSLK